MGSEVIIPDVFKGKICPYCKCETQLVDSIVIYGVSYGNIYICGVCMAYVGTHSDGVTSLGRLANKELRELKKEAHKYFDGLWKKKISMGTPKGKARHMAYKWLSEIMGTPPELTHIGMFDDQQCRRVINECKKYYNNG